MALKTAIVLLTAGELSQLQSGDLLTDPTSLISYGNLLSATANVAFTKGEIGYISGYSVGGSNPPIIDKAIADGTIDLRVCALCTATQAVASSATGIFLLIGGYMTGLSSLLGSNTSYFLSPTTAGAITSTAPSTAGQYVIKVGISPTNSKMLWKFERPILRS